VVFDSLLVQEIIFLHSLQNNSGAHPAFHPMGIFFTPEVKQPWHEAYHSLPSCAEVENNGIIPPLPDTLSWPGALLIMHRELIILSN
jgi:hypothetical protein